MNINEAKEEIKHTVQAYLLKDETGAYKIPVEKQRPVLLMGPPGIGKTAIMEQIAEEMQINLVSYTITHHTRQSAIGLPFISKRMYAGEEVSVTEYTMSEIIAAIYDQIERSGVQEGILFLDEINCVSETLAPTMLQFLQYKTFGSHKVPDGFVIVTAGNPPEYNRSVRDFDIVTLDRVKRMDVHEDFDAWKDFAVRAGVHGSILSYLSIKKGNFYSIKAGIQGKQFVTARGWEDLSRILQVYEEMNLPVNTDLVSQYLEDPEIARDFAAYYELYNKYRETYHVGEILEGNFPKDVTALALAPFDEKLSLIGLLIDALNQEFRQYVRDLATQQGLFTELKAAKAAGTSADVLAGLRDAREQKAMRSKKAHMLSRSQERTERQVIQAMDELIQKLRLEGVADSEAAAVAKQWFAEREQARKERIGKTDRHLTQAFAFMDKVFHEGQEMVIFLSDLSSGYYSLKFVTECGNEAYFKYNQFLLLNNQRNKLTKELKEMMSL